MVFEIDDGALRRAAELYCRQGGALVFADFEDVMGVLKGDARIGVGRAAGKNKAEEAAKMAISSPLLETSISKARGVLMDMIGGEDMGLSEVDAAADLVHKAVHPDAYLAFSTHLDQEMEDEMFVIVIASRFEEDGVPSAT